MRNDIITENINGFQFNELKETMKRMIEESIACLPCNDKKDYLSHLAWYKDCEMDDYLYELQEIWDENEKVGEGLNTIAHDFVLNDNTRANFLLAFEQARDEAYEAALEEIADLRGIKQFYHHS